MRLVSILQIDVDSIARIRLPPTPKLVAVGAVEAREVLAGVASWAGRLARIRRNW